MLYIINVETQEVSERDFTAAELKVFESDLANRAKEEKIKIEAENAKAAAQSKLAALGLTADDLKALGL